MHDKRVPLAWSVRWRRIRSQGIPVAMFLLAVVGSGWLMRERGMGVASVGEVSSPEVDVTSPTTGRIVALPNQTSGQWSVYDHIQAGEIVARIEEPSGETSKTVEIQAPISGTLVAIRCSPGQTVTPGQLIATIAADHGRHIVGYIPEESTLSAKPGMRVTLRSRAVGSPRLASEVEEVGVQIRKIPSHQRTSSTLPQWGTPVRIKVPSETMLRPGALVDVIFDNSDAR
jgi:multidrug efflux pump subunit AcrA (membrane-fusion protein)